MRKKLVSATLVLAAVGFLPLAARGDLEVSASVQIRAKADFEPGLATHGAWVEVGSYGRCWRPAHVTAKWRPYCAGEWVWTDCGWYWASDEPWAWACYHYGSWVFEPGYGWVWIPGVEWAPAWVSWRVGGGYIGWAPLPPRGWFSAGHASPDVFVFVGAKNFGGPVVSSRLIMKDKTILAKAPEVGGVKRESRTLSGSTHSVMVNHGPGVDMVQKASGKSFSPVPIHQAASRTPVPSSAKPGSAQAKASRDAGDRQEHAKSDSSRDLDHGKESHSSVSSDKPSGSHGRDQWGSTSGGRGGSGRGSGHGGGRH